MARVILGCQEVDTGEVVRPGKVGLWEMPDLATWRIDLREQNLFYGTTQDILRHRRKQQRHASSQYLGVAYHPKKQCWQAYVRVQGRLSMVGQFASEQEAAQARDQRVLALGLLPLVRLNFPGAPERSPALQPAPWGGERGVCAACAALGAAEPREGRHGGRDAEPRP